MGIAAFSVWKKRNTLAVKPAMIFYSIQLLLNAGWSLLFFGLHNPKLAFFEIMLLLVAILFTTFKFWELNKKAAALLFPYILWVLFASILNFTIWQLN